MSEEPEYLKPTDAEAIAEYEAFKRRGCSWPCKHDRLDEDGICRCCGKDCSGIG
jgi:hypothetical protein